MHPDSFGTPPGLHRHFLQRHLQRFPANPLIASAREKEYQLSRPPIFSRLPVDRWFGIRFMSRHTYNVISHEFRSLDRKTNTWEETLPAVTRSDSNFLRMPTGGGNWRRLDTNANLVGGGDYPYYIASEGPTRETSYDFWTMVWQEGITRIVSVNFPYEECLHDNVYKSVTSQYWPIVTGQIVSFMPFKIACLENRAMVSPDQPANGENEMVYRVTKLLVRKENSILGREPDREINHVCYYRWPDGRVPIAWPDNRCGRTAAIELVDILDKELPRAESPMLVHCHAGIGRTGVIISVHMALYQLRKTKTVNIKEVVEQLRHKRPRSVMSPWQYALVHLIVAEKAFKEGLIPDHFDGQTTREMLDRVWKDMEQEVKDVFGEKIVTYIPGLSD